MVLGSWGQPCWPCTTLSPALGHGQLSKQSCKAVWTQGDSAPAALAVLGQAGWPHTDDWPGQGDPGKGILPWEKAS